MNAFLTNGSRRAAVVCLAMVAVLFALQLHRSSAEMPLSQEFWRDPAFSKSFMGLFTPENRIEPFVSPEEKELLAEIAGLMADGSRESAVNRLRRADLTSSSAALQFNLGILEFQEDNLDAAVSSLTKALELYPDFRRAHASLGAVHMRREDPAAALPFLQRAVALGDSEGLTLGLLAYCRLQQQHYSSALQAYRLAQLTMPESPDWKAGEAECLRQTGDHAAAIRLFTEVLAVRPGDHETWIRLAHAQMNLDRHDQAAASLEMVRRLGRLTPPDTLLLGRIFLQLRSPTLALSRFSEAVAAEPPPEVGAVIEAADLLSQTLAWNETATLLQQIRSRFPDITALPENGDLERLEALLEMETGDPKAAAARLVEIVNRDPMDGRVLVTLGRHLAAEGDFVDAEMRLTQASKVPAFEAPALRELGQLHVTQGDYGAALEQLRRAQALEPDDSLARYIHAVEHAQAAAAGL